MKAMNQTTYVVASHLRNQSTFGKKKVGNHRRIVIDAQNLEGEPEAELRFKS